MRYFVKLPSGREIPVDVTHLPTGRLQVTVEGRALDVDAFGQGPSTHLSLDGRGVDLWIEGAPPDVGVVAGGRRFYARVESERMRHLGAAGHVVALDVEVDPHRVREPLRAVDGGREVREREPRRARERGVAGAQGHVSRPRAGGRRSRRSRRRRRTRASRCRRDRR